MIGWAMRHVQSALFAAGRLARTPLATAFTVLVIAQLFNAFNARSETGTAFHRVFANPWLWGAVVLSLALQVAVVHSPLLNAAFTTTPLSPSQWLVCAAMASTVLWASEIRKALIRLRARRAPASA